MAGDDLKSGISGLESGPQSTDAPESAPIGDPAAAESHPSVAALRAKFGTAIVHHTVMAQDEHVVYIQPERAVEILAWLKNDPEQRYDLLVDLTAVDYGGGRPLECVYQLWSIPHRRALRIKAVLRLDALEIESATKVWQSANWLEREVFDLFGINFTGHPDMRRIMMPDNYAEGHPLRKDFPLRGRFTRAEQTRRALSMEFEDFYTPDELAVTAHNEAVNERGEVKP